MTDSIASAAEYMRSEILSWVRCLDDDDSHGYDSHDDDDEDDDDNDDEDDDDDDVDDENEDRD